MGPVLLTSVLWAAAALAEPTVPEDALAWCARALSLEAQGNIAEASKAFTWALRLDGGNPDLHMAAARFFARQGLREGALAEMERAFFLTDEPDEEAVARVRMELYDLSGAVDALAMAVRSPRADLDTVTWFVAIASDACRIGTAWQWAREADFAEGVGNRIEALALDTGVATRCGVPGLVAAAKNAPASERIPLLERALDATPLSREVLDEMRRAYDEAGMKERVTEVDERIRIVKARMAGAR